MSWKHIGLFVVYDYFGCIEKRRNLFKMVISAPVSIKKTSYFPDDDDIYTTCKRKKTFGKNFSPIALKLRD